MVHTFKSFQKQMAQILAISIHSGLSAYGATKTIHSDHHQMLSYIVELTHRHFRMYGTNIVRIREIYPESHSFFDMEIRIMIVAFTGLLLIRKYDDARVSTFLT